MVSNMKIIQQVIATSTSANGLSDRIAIYIGEGFVPLGSHTVITTMINIERAGTVHRYTNQYSQTMVRYE
jgi:hypothetical protein